MVACTGAGTWTEGDLGGSWQVAKAAGFTFDDADCEGPLYVGVAPNSNPDGTDNPEGRRQNRRVEIIVTS